MNTSRTIYGWKVDLHMRMRPSSRGFNREQGYCFSLELEDPHDLWELSLALRDAYTKILMEKEGEAWKETTR